jgi:proliferating cell nuclear antigen
MEGRLPQGALLKKVFDAIKEMVTDVNLECSDQGMQVQAMGKSEL